MKLVYYSSVLNHHQRCLCDAFYGILGDDFAFVQTMPMEQQRIALGYQQEEAPYLIRSYESEALDRKARNMALEADVMLAGVFPKELLHERMKQSKLTFRHIETYFKRGKYRLLSPRAMKIAYTEHSRYRSKPLYLLCASAHVAEDVKLFGAYPDKKYRWGYFPETSTGNLVQRNNGAVTELLWAGRFIRWKKPDYAVRLAADLHRKGLPVHLTMIGTGPMEAELKALADSLQAGSVVRFCGAMPPTQVRRAMEQADVYLFTSTREEGWGAVLNEAVGCGCALVASAEAGSAKYLIPNCAYGLLYKKNSYSDLLSKTERLCRDPFLRRKMGQNGKKRIDSLWNYKIAAQRFIEVAESLLQEKTVDYADDGPMSKV